MAAVFTLQYWTTAVDAEKPTSGLVPGQQLFCTDTQKEYRAINSTTWVLIGGTHTKTESHVPLVMLDTPASI